MENLKLYAQLCLFRNNPLELPRSVSFFQKNLYFYILIELFIQANVTDPLEAMIGVAIETVLTLLFVAGLLRYKNAMPGFIAAASSFLLCENIVASFGLPVVVWLTSTDDLLSYYLMFVLIIWDVAIITYLIKRILIVDILFSLLLASSYFLVTYLGSYLLMIII
ncbi:hypothetical protein [Methylicorpusculum sp.]|uniref:hypothetical protein n=1 Tax=Methylicorpusculum sp. TaxID=2713644 RepID=UPI00272EF0A2|nr:hypothetical protein [Methylicorpusculum sp.]MDP2180653.1 hypothetical protein [Methylicorpusculum sp.]MDP3530428.1 hypothetical protein [Methylicorpusculum sp.]MDZ4154476.1 hypothetical protein [Methylicorpusculum sp.]